MQMLLESLLAQFVAARETSSVEEEEKREIDGDKSLISLISL